MSNIDLINYVAHSELVYSHLCMKKRRKKKESRKKSRNSSFLVCLWAHLPESNYCFWHLLHPVGWLTVRSVMPIQMYSAWCVGYFECDFKKRIKKNVFVKCCVINHPFKFALNWTSLVYPHSPWNLYNSFVEHNKSYLTFYLSFGCNFCVV